MVSLGLFLLSSLVCRRGTIGGINESLEIYRLIYGNCDGNYYDVDGDYGYHQFNSSVLAEDGNWIGANIRMSVKNFLKSELKSLLDLL